MAATVCGGGEHGGEIGEYGGDLGEYGGKASWGWKLASCSVSNKCEFGGES